MTPKLLCLNVLTVQYLCAKFHLFPANGSMGCHRLQKWSAKKKRQLNGFNRCLYTFCTLPNRLDIFQLSCVEFLKDEKAIQEVIFTFVDFYIFFFSSIFCIGTSRQFCACDTCHTEIHCCSAALQRKWMITKGKKRCCLQCCGYILHLWLQVDFTISVLQHSATVDCIYEQANVSLLLNAVLILFKLFKKNVHTVKKTDHQCM